MYKRHPILPIDIKYDLIDNNADKEPESNPYDISIKQYLNQQHLLEKLLTKK